MIRITEKATIIRNAFALVMLLALILPSKLSAQKVFRVEYESQADIKAFPVKYESQSDLKVFRVEYESQADSPGLWFFTRYESQADKKIFYVEYESQADLKVFFVEYESQAGWRDRSKSYLFD